MKFKYVNNSGHSLHEMATVGKFDECEVRIYAKEGPIPHFHIVNEKTEETCCLKILLPEYFNHADYMTGFLTNSDLKDLQCWLAEYSDAYKALNVNITVYQNICILWNQNNPNWKIDIPKTIPDYTKIN